MLDPCDNNRLATYALATSLLLDSLVVDDAPPLTKVGAMRLRLGCWLFSALFASRESLDSLFKLVEPAPPLELCGVSGGVTTGKPVTLPELVAVMLGTWPEISGGLLITPPCDVEA